MNGREKSFTHMKRIYGHLLCTGNCAGATLYFHEGDGH